MRSHNIHSLAAVNYPTSPKRKSLPPSSHPYSGNIQRLFINNPKIFKDFFACKFVLVANHQQPENIQRLFGQQPAKAINSSNQQQQSTPAINSNNQQQQSTAATSSSNQQQQSAAATSKSNQQEQSTAATSTSDHQQQSAFILPAAPTQSTTTSVSHNYGS